ncbi:hypothetical protein, partial [Acidisphaera rubrifaciens]|uniref:hypothetical protein n=1 Tax=Acidisphaera rubrifaciens TaxID=50715 RepID=UPI0006622B94
MSAAVADTRAPVAPDAAPHRLGTGAYAWHVAPGHADLSMPPAPPLRATIAAEPQTITVDLRRAA